MAKKFSELLFRMVPEARERARALTQAVLADDPPTEQKQGCDEDALGNIRIRDHAATSGEGEFRRDARGGDEVDAAPPVV